MGVTFIVFVVYLLILAGLAIGIPFMGVPQLMVRFMSARSEESLVPAMSISIVVIFCFGMGAVLTGMFDGLLTNLAWVIWLKPHAYELLEIISGFIVALILTITVSLMKAGKTQANVERKA